MNRAKYQVLLNWVLGPFSVALCFAHPTLETADAKKEPEDLQRKSDHWAYRQIRDLAPPDVDPDLSDDPDRDAFNVFNAFNAIDRFVLRRLQAEGITASPLADRTTLIRRLCYDLLGLPPDPAEVDAFVADDSPDAYERLLDRLLAAPHFGERWGRHWLDKARYADSDGYEKDKPRPNAWRYRDWVVEAINRDLPFDEFTIQQLAGDLLTGATPMHRLATAFHRQTLTNTEGGTDQEQFRHEAIFDRVSTTGTIWLGLTVGCAQCHSHKYDRITQDEYYQFFAFFNNADEGNTEVPVSAAAIEEYEGQKKRPHMRVRVMTERSKNRRDTRLLYRGDFLQPQHKVEAGTFSTLHPFKKRNAKRPADRLDFANWLLSAENPLTPRVLANDLWMRLFGKGIVSTANDFGVRGDPPSHPHLLDWLAREYRELGWSRKAMIRTILRSAAYRRSSGHRPELNETDPNNRWLYRQNRLRVEAEIVRDLYLGVSGLLSRKIGGKSVFPPMPPEVAALSYANNFKWATSQGGDRYRRGMYTFFKRTAPHPTLITFDCPDANTAVIQRRTSNTPLQALETLNNTVFVEAARELARRALTERKLEDDRLVHAFRLCVARSPDADELRHLRGFLATSRRWYEERAEAAKQFFEGAPVAGETITEAAAWTAVLRVVLNLDEFITRE